MKLPSKQLRISLVVAIVGVALATGSAFAQRAGTSTPSPSSPSVGAGTAAPPAPLGNPPSVGAGTAASEPNARSNTLRIGWLRASSSVRIFSASCRATQE